MAVTSPERRKSLEALINSFLQERLQSKLDGLASDDPKVDEITRQHELSTWIAAKAKQAQSMSVATHIVKPMHPDAKGTELYVRPQDLPKTQYLGSCCVDSPALDLVGNAAYLDMYPFLVLDFEGATLFELLLAGDSELLSILSTDKTQAEAVMRSFTKMQDKPKVPSSHFRAKQIYWLTGEDPLVDSDYRMLAPLYASSLAHRINEIVVGHKYGDEAKQVRKDKVAGHYNPSESYDYRNLVVQKLGGSKPQNISKLNSSRKGVNYLFPSIPPSWMERDVRPLLGRASVFDRFGRRRDIQLVVDQLRDFLCGDPASSRKTADTRDDFVEELVDRLDTQVAKILTLEPGWTSNPLCFLPRAEMLWLDPLRAEVDEEFAIEYSAMHWKQEISRQFARWLNRQLQDKLPVGDAEYDHWRGFFEDYLRLVC